MSKWQLPSVIVELVLKLLINYTHRCSVRFFRLPRVMDTTHARLPTHVDNKYVHTNGERVVRVHARMPPQVEVYATLCSTSVCGCLFFPRVWQLYVGESSRVCRCYFSRALLACLCYLFVLLFLLETTKMSTTGFIVHLAFVSESFDRSSGVFKYTPVAL